MSEAQAQAQAADAAALRAGLRTALAAVHVTAVFRCAGSDTTESPGRVALGISHISVAIQHCHSLNERATHQVPTRRRALEPLTTMQAEIVDPGPAKNSQQQIPTIAEHWIEHPGPSAGTKYPVVQPVEDARTAAHH